MRRMKIGLAALAVVGFACASCRAGGESGPVYQQDFQDAMIGIVPDDMFVLDGGFAVRQNGAEKYLELPGAPLESFGVLFGPTETEGVAVSARIYGTNKGRRMPAFAVGLNGVSGFRLQVSPAKKLVELYEGNTVKVTVPYDWKSGEWTRLRLHVTKEGAVWQLAGKVWAAEQPEPVEPMIRYETAEEPPPGRASVWGSPYSGTPIRFDDLIVTTAKAKN